MQENNIVTRMLDDVRKDLSGMHPTEIQEMLRNTGVVMSFSEGEMALGDTFSNGLLKGLQAGMYVSEGLRVLSEKKEKDVKE